MGSPRDVHQCCPIFKIASVDVSAKIEQCGDLTRVLAVGQGGDSTFFAAIRVHATLYEPTNYAGSVFPERCWVLKSEVDEGLPVVNESIRIPAGLKVCYHGNLVTAAHSVACKLPQHSELPFVHR